MDFELSWLVKQTGIQAMTNVSAAVFPDDLIKRAEALLASARTAGLRIATAESCTGGLIAAVLTEVPGASDVFDRGFVTYSNQAKTESLNVPSELIEHHGAVSREVAQSMAEGALALSGADISVAVSGIAGPDGGSDQKPVGLVHIAVHRKGRLTRHHECRFGEIGRTEIRMATVGEALTILHKMIAS
jgi:nicotinamide-nucleotide amidase